MWQTKYAAAVPKNLGLGLNFWPCSAISSLGVRSPWNVLSNSGAAITVGPFLFCNYFSNFMHCKPRIYEIS